MNVGTQIVYIPTHAEGDVTHPDCEFGFIFGSSHNSGDKAYFCRYWRKRQPGVLRTTACSELTNARDIQEYQSVPQEVVTKTIDQILDPFLR